MRAVSGGNDDNTTLRLRTLCLAQATMTFHLRRLNFQLQLLEIIILSLSTVVLWVIYIPSISCVNWMCQEEFLLQSTANILSPGYNLLARCFFFVDMQTGKSFPTKYAWTKHFATSQIGCNVLLCCLAGMIKRQGFVH